MTELDKASVMVVGARPAGLAAALSAANACVDVVLLDAAPAAAGQVWRARQGVVADPVAHALSRFARARVRLLADTRVVMALPGRILLIDGPDGARRLRWEPVILASSARERLLPFPGWTLPGAFGAGGLRALVKGGRPLRGKRVLVAGIGPLLLAAAATLRCEGAQLIGRVVGAELMSTPPAMVHLTRRLARELAFAAAVATAFAPPADWGDRLRDDTLVCRCEDVSWPAVRTHPDLRSAKQATRCGMRHCQGRLCHDTLASVMHWPRLPVRPPLSPAPLATPLAIPAPFIPEEP
jgi:hypothetical protein